MRPILALASSDFIEATRRQLDAHGVVRAIADHDSATIYSWLVPQIALQGISDHAAQIYQARTTPVRWVDIEAALAASPSCPCLRCYWTLACGYRKAARTCAKPQHLAGCPVASLGLRKGSLSEGAMSLYLFIRDVADGDLVGFIDSIFDRSDPGVGAPNRAVSMRAALLDPLCQIRSVGPKVWSMVLADLLLAGDASRERWVTVGASMIAVDGLVDAFLARTGLIDRFGVRHAIGPLCYSAGGCSAVIERLAQRFNARSINPTFPTVFPRLVQHSIWAFCAADQWNICNARKIDDRGRCKQRFCPCFRVCDRIAIR